MGNKQGRQHREEVVSRRQTWPRETDGERGCEGEVKTKGTTWSVNTRSGSALTSNQLSIDVSTHLNEEKKPERTAEAAPSQTYDVIIAATPADAELVAFIKARLKSASMQVYWNSGETSDSAKLTGKVLVDAKLLVFVASESASQNSRCQDLVSLAYISNKPIVIAAKQSKANLIKNFQVGMRLTLQSLLWAVFDNEAEKQTVGQQFIQLVQEQLTKANGEQGFLGDSEDSLSEGPMEATPSQTYDVVIAATSADAELVAFIKAQLESASIQVYWNSGETSETAKLAGKVLVDAKILVFVVSESTSKNSHCEDLVSLAYISNKPILIAAKRSKTELIQNFRVGMKLTLQSLLWIVFDNEAEKETVGQQFIQLVREQLTKYIQEQQSSSEAHLSDALPILQRGTVTQPSPASTVSTLAETDPQLSKIELADLEFMDNVGAGSFGKVWKGRWKSKNKIVAIKKVMELEKQLKREIDCLSLLDHPNVIQYYGTATGQETFMGHFIITEFAENGSIYDYINQKHQQLTLMQSLLWARQVAEGMQYVHGRDIIHRDLKSRNVVLTSTLKAKICDLGSARNLQHTMRQTTAVGTYAWMAPEMLRREKVSKSCDVYSYGVLVFEIATQQVPFPDVNPIVAAVMTMDGKWPTIPETCDPHLADLIKCCWQQDPKGRPSFEEILVILRTLELPSDCTSQSSITP